MILLRRVLAALSLALAAALALPAPGAAADSVFAPGGIAIGGYDPVAYFVAGQPQPGSAEHALKWRGVLWYFSSAENMTAFEMNPKGYAPQYGGYCAYALAQGEVAGSDPRSFAIHEGRLYLTQSEGLRARWVKDIATHVAAGDANWRSLFSH